MLSCHAACTQRLLMLIGQNLPQLITGTGQGCTVAPEFANKEQPCKTSMGWRCCWGCLMLIQMSRTFLYIRW